MNIFHMHISKYFLHWSMVRDIFSVCVTFIMEVVVKKEHQRRFCKTSTACFFVLFFNALLLNALDFT